MSTEYYRLKPPFTSIRIDSDAAHDRVTLWEDHANAGTLVLSSGRGRILARMLSDDGPPVMRSYWGGSEVGTVVTESVSDLNVNEFVLSEYGECLTVERVRARAGAKRADGMPTELFGFEGESK